MDTLISSPSPMATVATHPKDNNNGDNNHRSNLSDLTHQHQQEAISNHQHDQLDHNSDLDLSLKSMFNGQLAELDTGTSGTATIATTNNNSNANSGINNLKSKFNNNQQSDTINNENNNDHEQIKLLKELSDMKQKIRKLQQESDDLNEIITELTDLLEQTKEQNDKLRQDNLKLIQDARQAKVLRDENDVLQERVLRISQLELDIKRYKDRINELEFFKLRNSELEDDYNKLNDSKCHIEEQIKQCHEKLDKISELEQELDKWRNYSQEVVLERDTLQTRILELIDNEAKLKLDNERAEDELVRLKNELKNFTMKQEELEETNNMQLLSCGPINEHPAHLDAPPHSTPSSSSLASSISQHHNSLELKLELEKQKQQELTEENKQLKSKLVDLRQDLTCEKSINDQLSRKLKNFNCTIRKIDRNFPASVTADFNKEQACNSYEAEKKDDEEEKEEEKPTSSGIDNNKVTVRPPAKSIPSTSSSIVVNGHDSGFLSIGQDSEGQSNNDNLLTASNRQQQQKSTSNNLPTASESRTSPVIDPIVVKSTPERAATASTPALASAPAPAAAATTAATTAAVTAAATATSISLVAKRPNRAIQLKSATTTGTNSKVQAAANHRKVSQSVTPTSNQSQSINLHPPPVKAKSFCSPTKVPEIDPIQAKLDSIQSQYINSNNTGGRTGRHASTKEKRQQVCQLSASSDSSAASSTRCSPQLVDGVDLSANSRSSPSNTDSKSTQAITATATGRVIVDTQQQQSESTANSSIKDLSSSPTTISSSSSSQLNRNSLLNSSASGAKLVSNFVRNSCPSRSINFGHSSSYLERYRSAQQQQQHQSQPAISSVAPANQAEQQSHHHVHPAFAHHLLAAHPANTGLVAGGGGQSSPSQFHQFSHPQQHQRVYQQQGSPSSSTNGCMTGASGSYISQVKTQQVNYENGAHMLQIGAKLNYVPNNMGSHHHHHHHHQQQQQQQQHLNQSFNTMSLNRQTRADSDHHRLASALVDADYAVSPHSHLLAHHHHHHHLLPILHQHSAPSPPVVGSGCAMRVTPQHQHDINGLSPATSHQHSAHQYRPPLVWPLPSARVDGGQSTLVSHGGVKDNASYASTPAHNQSAQDGLGLMIHHQVQQHQQQSNATSDSLGVSMTGGAVHHQHHQVLLASSTTSVDPHLQQQHHHRSHNHHNHHHHHHLCQSRTLYTVSPIGSPVSLACGGTQDISGLPEVNENMSLVRNKHQQQRASSSSESSTSSSSSSSSSFSNSSSTASTPNEDSHNNDNNSHNHHHNHQHQHQHHHHRHQGMDQQQHKRVLNIGSRGSNRMYMDKEKDSEDQDGQEEGESDKDAHDDYEKMNIIRSSGNHHQCSHVQIAPGRQHHSQGMLTNATSQHQHGPVAMSHVTTASYKQSPSMVKMSKICNTTQLLDVSGAASANGTPTILLPTNNNNGNLHMRQQYHTTSRNIDNNDCDSNEYSITTSQKHLTQSPQKSPNLSRMVINNSSSSSPSTKSDHQTLAAKSMGSGSKKSTKERLIATGQSTKLCPSSDGSSPVKAHISHNNNNNNNDNNNADNSSLNNSSVWYEYGCV